jgi:hypothetical protein
MAGLVPVGVAVLVAGGVASAVVAGSGGVSATPFGILTNKIPNPSRKITAVRGDRMWERRLPRRIRLPKA